ncbi:MAG: glycoside hydrolase family 5 protein [Aromatoleum sp.]|jgi:endoglucanase|uniref:glycoside hydrolase family 5 protein n=1 Tax=Aromatoleum sp. TaxID=2307007 RepID=UPI00289617C6|nr:glycoside hydrolase family 5 protein [Aromatoleum sp.]MDT3670969.1 glycoside hydrolase family 5 protein [Aromatoleum sp.]
MTNRWILGCVLVCSLVTAGSAAAAGCLDGPLVGVNLAGAEFNSKKLPGVMNKDYVYPAADDVAYFAQKGATAIRLPFRWERAQPTLMGELDTAEMTAIDKTIAAASVHGLCVILDAHNYATYRGLAIGSEDVPNAAFVDFWTRMGKRFPDADRVAFGLMNEPKQLLIAQWAELAQTTVQNLRSAGVQNLLMVSGGRWSGVHEWSKVFSGTSNAVAFAGFTDPLDRSLIEVHQYADANFSGTGTECQPPERFDNMFALIADWARANNKKLFLGEFGTPANEPCLATLDHLLSLSSDRNVWRGWTYWAAGRWWGSYPLSIHPKSGVDAPQMGVVSKYLGR